jgi:hypothetical protein
MLRNSESSGLNRKWLGGALFGGAVAMAVGIAACGGGSSGGTSHVSHGLAAWVANAGLPNVVEFSGNQFSHKGGVADVKPRKAFGTTNFTAPQDTFFDSSDNLWVVDGGDGDGDGSAVFKFTPAQLKALNKTPNPTPAFTINSLAGGTGFLFPQFGAFDSSGNMWVSDSAQDVIFEFTAMQLSATGGSGITPAAILSSESFDGVLGMAFDSAGNLWVANNGDESLVKIAAADLTAASGNGAQTIPISATFNSTGSPLSLDAPWGLAFDGAGDLWVTNEQPDFAVSASAAATSAAPAATPTIGQGTIVEFSAAVVNAATGASAPTPAVVLTPASVDGGMPSIDDPNGVTIDLNKQSLVIANAAGNSLSGYNLNGIVSGSPVPNIFLEGTKTTLTGPAGLIIGPSF